MAKRKKKGDLLPLFILLLAAGVTAALVHFKAKPEEEEPETPSLSVVVSPIEEGEIEWKTRFQGEVRAKTAIDLVSQVNGKVTAISSAFTEGGAFSADDTLLSIEKADYLVALESARATVAEAEVNLEIELANSDVRKKQWKELGSSTAKATPLQLNYPQVAQARARLKAARAELHRAELDLKRTRISVPFNGRVKEKFVGAGQFVTRGERLANVFATDSVEIRVPMTDQQLSELQLTPGAQPQLSSRIKGSQAIVSKSFGNERYTWVGRLVGVDATIDPRTRLVYATISVDNPYAEVDKGHLPLAPGFFVDVEIEALQKLRGLKVPRNALRRGDSVYLFKNEKLLIRDVEVLQTSAKLAILSGGLHKEVGEGALVITSPVPGAYEGMSIKLNKVVSKLGSKSAEIMETTEGEAIVSKDQEKTETSL